MLKARESTDGRIRRVLHHIELLPLICSLLVAAGLWLFVELADEVREGATETFDRTVLLAMRSATDRSDPLGPLWFEEVMRDITSLGGMAVLTLLSVAVLGFLLLQRKRGMALFMTVSLVGGTVLSNLLKMGFQRPRPDLVPHGTYVMSASFPSGHSLLSAVVFLTLGGLLARSAASSRLKLYILSLAIVLTLLVGISRVYLGVHWPTDVLAGWVAGSSWALMCWFVALLLQRRGRVERGLEEAGGEAVSSRYRR